MVTILDPEDKYSILDIKATLDDGSRVNIEGTSKKPI